MTHYYYRVQRWNASAATWHDVNCFSTLTYALKYLRLQTEVEGNKVSYRILCRRTPSFEEVVFARYTPEQGYEYFPEEK